MNAADMPALAAFIARGLDEREGSSTVAGDVSEWRQQFSGIHSTTDQLG